MPQRESFQIALERFGHAPCATGEGSVCAPINNEGLFQLLLQEAERIALRLEDTDLLLMSDAATLARLQDTNAVLARAARTMVFQNRADLSAAEKGQDSGELPSFEASDRLFLLLSSSMSLALFAHEPGEKSATAGQYSGGWTVQRSIVLQLAESLVDAEDVGDFLTVTPEHLAADRISAAAMRLSGLYAETVSGALERAQLLERLKLANVRLEHLATTDALTGLHNRRHFQERMDHEVERAARYGLPLSFLMLDVDGFKHVNDTRGHLIGDAVLKGISARMQGCTRRVDLIARYGGEEFAIILPQTGGGGAVTEAERLRIAIGGAPIDTVTGPVAVTASIGVAVFDQEWMRTGDDLIGSADEALLRAKQLGKNRVVMADNREGKP